MTAEAIIEIVAIIVTVLLALFGCTWFIGSQLAGMKVTLALVSTQLQAHIDKDDRRFDEVFTQQRELANQHFWLAGNLVVDKPKGVRGRGPEG